MYTLTIQAANASEMRAKLKDLLGSQPGYDQAAVDAAVTDMEKAAKLAKAKTDEAAAEATNLEEVKVLIVKLIEQGKRDEVLAVLKKFGVKKVQDVSEDDWEIFTDEVKAL